MNYGSGDRVIVTYDDSYPGAGNLTVEQDGENSRVLLDGRVVAVLPTTLAGDVRAELQRA